MERYNPSRGLDPCRCNTTSITTTTKTKYQIKEITEYIDGKVKLSFHRHSTSSKFSDESSTSSTIDLGKISKILSVINILYHANPLRKSTFDIPNTSFQNVDYTTNTPKPLYTNPKQQSPPTSPTFSEIIENIQNKLNFLTSGKEFVIEKIYFKNDFYGTHNFDKRFCFFKTFLQQRHEIQKYFYDFITLHKVKILFFDWFEMYYAFEHHIAYPFTSEEAFQIEELATSSSDSETPSHKQLNVLTRDQ